MSGTFFEEDEPASRIAGIFGADKKGITCFPHRPPQGPNEDVAVCERCGSLTFEMRPEHETYGEHLPDCSLPRFHESYCEPGGAGHPRAEVIRGWWPTLGEA